MRIWLCLVLFVGLSAAAPDVKVPAAREALLKQRASKFWQYFVDGKFRLADALVSDDSKDYYYTWPKKRIQKFRLEKIEYSEGGKRALVIAVANTEMTLMAVGTMPIEQPVYTHWRFEKGSWYWFYPKNELRQTPFGPMPTGEGGGAGSVVPDVAGMVRGGPKLSDLEKMVVPDRDSVSFTEGVAGEQTVVIQNAMPGVVTMRMDPLPPGELSCALESNEIAKKSTTKLFIRYKPVALAAGAEAKPAPKADCVVAIAQTGKAHAIHVQVLPKQ